MQEKINKINLYIYIYIKLNFVKCSNLPFQLYEKCAFKINIFHHWSCWLLLSARSRILTTYPPQCFHHRFFHSMTGDRFLEWSLIFFVRARDCNFWTGHEINRYKINLGKKSTEEWSQPGNKSNPSTKSTKIRKKSTVKNDIFKKYYTFYHILITLVNYHSILNLMMTVAPITTYPCLQINRLNPPPA